MTLKFYLLGQFKLQADDLSIELPSRPAQSTLAYLVLNAGVAQRREKLSSLIWPQASESNARSYLRQALWRIRKSIESCSLISEDFLHISDISVAFNNQSDYWLDADVLLKEAEMVTIEELTETVSLYHGEFLPGFYEDWVVLERDLLQAAYLQKMNLLLDRLIQTQQWDLALKWGEQWIKVGDAHEPAYRALMSAHAGLGDQAMASASYQRCVKALDRELGIAPSAKTKKLYEQILCGEFTKRIPVSPYPDHIIHPPTFLDQKEPQQAERPLFVACEKELAQLESYLDEALAKQGRVVFVTGEAGSGKTSLIEEFSNRVQDSYPELVVARGNCNAHTGIGDPYLPFREVLELLTGDVEARWIAGTINRQHAQRLWNVFPITVQALLEQGPDLVNTFIPGSSLIQRARTYSSGKGEWFVRLNEHAKQQVHQPVSSRSLQHHLFAQFSRVLSALAREVPLLILLDDMQWADQGSISLLFHLGRHLAGDRLLILGAFRREELALGREEDRHPLEPVLNEFQRQYGDIAINLDRADDSGFVKAVLDSEPNLLSKSFHQMLQQQTRGHPLFTIELLRGMQERGDLVQDQHGRWRESSSLNWETLPARVEAVIAERVGRLSRPLRALLRVASVEGEEFTAEVIARVQGVDESQVFQSLNSELDRRHHLIRTQSIQRINDQFISRYRFRHILIQKYLYGSLNAVECVHLHEQVGLTLEGLFIPSDEILAEAAVAPQLARHFQEAKIKDKAIHYLRLAGERALQLSAYKEAFVHLTRGLELLMSEPVSLERAELELALQFSLSIVLKGLKSNSSPETEKALKRTHDLCRQLNKKTELCVMLGELVIVHYVRAEYERANTLSEETLYLAQQLRDPILITLGYWQLGFVHFGQGNFTSALKHLDEVIELYRPDQHHQQFVSLRGSDAGVSALAFKACCLWCLGYPDQANEFSQKALSLTHDLGHPFSRADALYFAGCLFNSMCRDASKLKLYAEELGHLSDEQVTGWQGEGKIFIGEALSLSGLSKEAISHINEGIQAVRVKGIRCNSSGAKGTLALSQAKSGAVDSGLKTLAEALIFVEETNERFWEAELYRLYAEILLMKADDEEAEVCLVKAIEIARRQKAKSWELRATTDLARLWQDQGKREQARNMLEEICSWFTEGFETPDLLSARVLLDELQ